MILLKGRHRGHIIILIIVGIGIGMKWDPIFLFPPFVCFYFSLLIFNRSDRGVIGIRVPVFVFLQFLGVGCNFWVFVAIFGYLLLIVLKYLKILH